MNAQITKKQFIIISALVILITLVIIITVSNRNKNKELNNDISNIQSSNNVSINEQNVDNNESVIKPENIEKEQEISYEIEEELSTTVKGKTLQSIADEIEGQEIVGQMFEPTKEEIDDFMDIDVSIFDEYMIKMSTNKFKSELYMIFKPLQNNEEKAMAQIKNFLINYENSWSSLDYKQYDIVSTRKAIKRNGYLIYVVTANNDEVLKIIRKYI